MATCEKPGDVLDTISKALFREKFHIRNPEKQEREAIIKWLLDKDQRLMQQIPDDIRQDIDVVSIAKYLQGKCFKEIRSILLKVTSGLTDQRIQDHSIFNESVLKKLSHLEKERRAFGEKAVRIPEVKWADVGGLANAKEDIMQTIMLPIEKPHLFKSKL